MRPFTQLMIGIGGLILLQTFIELRPTDMSTASPSSTSIAPQPIRHVDAPRQDVVPTWSYRTDTDQMTGNRQVWAGLRSKNSLQMDFPYRGENHGLLFIRQHPRWGLDVFIQIAKGQIMCRQDDCRVVVRFDGGKPITFSGVDPEDNDPTVVFIQNEKRFIENAKKAKRILVQMTYYKAGSQVLEFEAEKPLQWPPPN